MLERPDEPGRPDVRIDDADRHRMVEVLRRHCGEGRLTLDEFSDRVEVVFDARTRGELDAVVSDLPAVATPVPETRRRKIKRWAVAIMSGHTRKGKWRPAEEMTALAIMGGCDLDFRQAEIDQPEIRITAIAIMGGIDIVVPEGIAVDVSGLPLLGDFSSRVKDSPIIPGSPVIRVRGFSLMGGVCVRNKRQRSPEIEAQARALKQEARLERQIEHARRQAERAQRHAQRHAEKWGIEVPRLDEILESALGGGASRDVEPDGWREQLKSHAAPDGTVTIMFTDMEGYTEATVRLGDLKARELLQAHNQIVREQITAHGGFEVKSQGDSFMVAFAGASRALRCAVAIQKAFDRYCDKRPDEPIRVHIGLHTGEVIRENDDFLGRTVILASRIASAAKGGEILVSALLKELTDGTGEFTFDDPREVVLKGLTSPHTLYPVCWSS